MRRDGLLQMGEVPQAAVAALLEKRIQWELRRQQGMETAEASYRVLDVTENKSVQNKARKIWNRLFPKEVESRRTSQELPTSTMERRTAAVREWAGILSSHDVSKDISAPALIRPQTAVVISSMPQVSLCCCACHPSRAWY